jgi:hypothetical protein
VKISDWQTTCGSTIAFKKQATKMAPKTAKTQALAKIKQHYSSKRRPTLSPKLWSNLPNNLALLILKKADYMITAKLASHQAAYN